MRYLYLLLLFSLAALLWAAFSIARHIRRQGRQARLSDTSLSDSSLPKMDESGWKATTQIVASHPEATPVVTPATPDDKAGIRPQNGSQP